MLVKHSFVYRGKGQGVTSQYKGGEGGDGKKWLYKMGHREN